LEPKELNVLDVVIVPPQPEHVIRSDVQNLHRRWHFQGPSKLSFRGKDAPKGSWIASSCGLFHPEILLGVDVDMGGKRRIRGGRTWQVSEEQPDLRPGFVAHGGEHRVLKGPEVGRLEGRQAGLSPDQMCELTREGVDPYLIPFVVRHIISIPSRGECGTEAKGAPTPLQPAIRTRWYDDSLHTRNRPEEDPPSPIRWDQEEGLQTSLYAWSGRARSEREHALGGQEATVTKDSNGPRKGVLAIGLEPNGAAEVAILVEVGNPLTSNIQRQEGVWFKPGQPLQGEKLAGPLPTPAGSAQEVPQYVKIENLEAASIGHHDSVISQPNGPSDPVQLLVGIPSGTTQRYDGINVYPPRDRPRRAAVLYHAYPRTVPDQVPFLTRPWVLTAHTGKQDVYEPTYGHESVP
jgi:hypothetical protein